MDPALRTDKRAVHSISKERKPLRLGFLPESDCAPVIVAYEFGLFKKHGLEVELHGQPSWKHVHDNIVHGELDAAHAPAMLPFLINLGLTPEKCDCMSGLILSLQGNTVVVSRELWRLGVRDAATLREQMWQDRKKKIYTFGFSSPLSTEHFLFWNWLRSVPAPPCTDVRSECIPSEQLFPLLKLGYLDGYCATEPWGSVAVQAGVGACLESSATLAPGHPEKVLLVRKAFARDRAEEHEHLIAALLDAAYLCEQPENRSLLCELLAQPQFVNAPVACLDPGLIGPFSLQDKKCGSIARMHCFYGPGVNEPDAAKASWLAEFVLKTSNSRLRTSVVNHTFRADIFRRAQRLLPPELRGQPAAQSHRSSLVTT